MSKIYYTSDLHFGHENVIKFDNRPFQTVKQMNETIINNWNKKVHNDDMVYILGDFCWGKQPDWIYFLSMLKGQKALITGNHDLKQMSSNLKRLLFDIKPYKDIADKDRRVIMCHYPIPFYVADYSDNCYMLYGHLHNTIEETFMQDIKTMIKENDYRGKSANKCHFYNCFCGFYDYEPVTLDEIIQKNNQ